jgi:uncharacterized membrane protein
MKSIAGFLKTTLLGGVFFLMPIVTLAIILDKALKIADKIAKPVSEHVPGDWDFGVGKATLLALCLTICLFSCWAAGAHKIRPMGRYEYRDDSALENSRL